MTKGDTDMYVEMDWTFSKSSRARFAACLSHWAFLGHWSLDIGHSPCRPRLS